MDDESAKDQEPATETCGCEEPPRRLCDACRSDTYVFIACSLRCLRRHQVAVHGEGLAASTETRIREFQQELNRHAPAVWKRYAAHRNSLMSHVPPPPKAGGDVIVLGAGSCSDFDLGALADSFSEVHLVDIDGAALERARDQQPSQSRNRIVLHGDVDLSGFLDRIEEWGESFPDVTDLGQAAVVAAHGIVDAIGRSFDVTVSTCVLSQLMQPFQSVWVLPEDEWTAMDAAVTAVHLATLAGLTRSGGQGFIAFDVLSSAEIPELGDLRTSSADELRDFVEREREAGRLMLQPDPGSLIAQLQSPGLGSLFVAPRITSPWLWDIGDAHQLVYGLVFGRH